MMSAAKQRSDNVCATSTAGMDIRSLLELIDQLRAGVVESEQLGQLMPRVPGSPHVFPRPTDGQPVQTWSKQWRRLRDRAGLPKGMRTHDMRHAWARTASANGVSINKIRIVLGHKRIEQTQHYLGEDIWGGHDAAEVFSRAIQGGAS